MSDTCPVQGWFIPLNAKVAANNSVKQAWCLTPALVAFQAAKLPKGT
nr:hypothetical protein [Sporomusa acidovorans]OZC14676.1 hypothetical protein SPACI_52240 [Sporomusa acidovorans DSM 3132]